MILLMLICGERALKNTYKKLTFFSLTEKVSEIFFSVFPPYNSRRGGGQSIGDKVTIRKIFLMLPFEFV